MPNTEKTPYIFKITGKVPATINGLSMFLNSTDHANLTMTAKNVVLRTKRKHKSKKTRQYQS